MFGGKGICCDSTYGTIGYDFKLTSLLAVDDFGEGFPVAWYLSNHEDFNTMEVFLEKLKSVNRKFSFHSSIHSFYWNKGIAKDSNVDNQC